MSGYRSCLVQISKVDQSGNGFESVLENLDFTTIAVSIDILARFDFMCLLDNAEENTVVAVFGGAKLYSSNISSDTFADNVLSCDPEKAFLGLAGKPTNDAKRDAFVELWRRFQDRVKSLNKQVKILMLAFAYPHPVGTVEYPAIHVFNSDKLVCCFGSEKIIEISKFAPCAGSLVLACAGAPSQRAKRKHPTAFESALKLAEVKKSKKK
jgi:hypothetical protein